MSMLDPNPGSPSVAARQPGRRVLGMLIALALLATGAFAGGLPPDQPLVSFWFPNDLLSWNPDTDPDAPYNRSGVPLRDRFYDAATQANDHARPGEGTVAALSVMFPTTSNNPAQGGYSFDTYALGYWQYLDLLVFWGGSAGEGLILAPNPGVVDAAHKNGVRVLGNIFFPPNAFGGDIQWVRDMVQKSGPTFPVADKLIEVAETYGFDGWFVNQETSGGDTQLATDVRDFMRYLQDNSDLTIQWYDAMIENGQIFYQNALTANNDSFLQESGMVTSNSMFLNYGWNGAGLINSGSLAQSLGRSQYDLFAGVNVGNNGFDTTVNWGGLFPEGQPHSASLGFFATHWTFQSSANRDEFYDKARIFWSGPNEDPSNTDTANSWRGVAHYIPAASSIDSIPFVTSFDTGQGDVWAAEGEIRRTGPWHQRGLQDVLPTWRWTQTTTGPSAIAELVWNQAYEGGTSLRMRGNLTEDVVLDLFKTRLDLVAGTNLRVVFRTGHTDPSRASILLYFDDGAGGLDAPIAFPLGTPAGIDWQAIEFDLSAFAGERVAKIALEAAGSTDPNDGFNVFLGQLAIIDGEPDVPQPPTGLLIDNRVEIDPLSTTVRLRWDASPDPVHAYHVYRRDTDGGLTWLGGTANTALFVPRLDRQGGELETTIEVEAVGAEMGRSTRATTTFTWNDPLQIFADGFESGDVTAWSLSGD